MATVNFHHFPGTTVVVCLLTLDNGFHIIGHAACENVEEFSLETGKLHAQADAERKQGRYEAHHRMAERYERGQILHPQKWDYYV